MARQDLRKQKQRHQKIFARFARRIRRARGFRRTIQLMGESFSALVGADYDGLQALIDLSELVTIHQPRVEPDEVFFRIRDVSLGNIRADL